MNNKTITFIGAGNMASAIIGGLRSQGISGDRVWASCPSDAQLSALKREQGIQTTTDNQVAARQADVIVLAVKPQVLQSVCENLSNALSHRPLIISIAAGVETASLDNWLGHDLPIIRCMPNTPAQVRKGASGLVANARVDDEQKKMALSLFSSIGIADWLDHEHQIHAVTALSGSGPAYIFMVIEAMESAAISQGIDAQTARRLAAQTVAGAAEMVLRSDIEPSQLKRNVMSPGGTTERAIQSFENDGLVDVFARAMEAAASRSEELAKLMKSS